MTSRERILKALNHEEADRIPYDLASTTWTGISNIAYQNLLAFLGRDHEIPNWADVIQQIVIPSEPVLEMFNADARGLMPLTSHNWSVYENLTDAGENWEYTDEWNFIHHFPKNDGKWFTIVRHPMENISEPGIENIKKFSWPQASDTRRIKGLREKALYFKEKGKIVILKGLCAGVFEMHQRLRGMSNALTDPLIYPGFSEKLIGKIADLKIQFWEMALEELSDMVDILAEGDDYGTQDSQLISPDQFRKYYKTHVQRVIKAMKQKAPHTKIMFHSCGNVHPIIPDFIESGIDILNPVHINASGMNPSLLKKDFGKDIVFWGGGIDTQRVLPYGSPEEVADNVKQNIDHFAPEGGFVFSTVHNIQADVPPQNIMMMWETLMEHGKY